MRELLDHETQDVRAEEAVALFCYQVKKWIGHSRRSWADRTRWCSLAASPTVRARICDGLGLLGIELNEKRNAASEGVISANASRVTVRVIHADEELMIARSVTHLLGLGTPKENGMRELLVPDVTGVT
jgi:acetate kinase